MLIKKTQILNTKEYNKAIFHEGVFLDIETTGLNPRNSKIAMIGLLYYDGNNYKLVQFFSEKINEKQILIKALYIIKKFKYIICYNGLSFDLKFIKKRAEYHNLNSSLFNKCIIDFLRIFRLNKEYLPVENFKLKTIEKFMNISRKDNLSGKDFIKLYNSYLLTPKKEYLELMLQHNYEDVKNLPSLFKLYEMIGQGDNVNYKEFILPLFIKKASMQTGPNYINFHVYTYSINNADSILEGFNYKIYWKKRNGLMEIRLYTESGKLRDKTILSFINLNEIFYESIYIKNKYNISENLLVLKEEKNIIIENLELFMKLLFANKKIP